MYKSEMTIKNLKAYQMISFCLQENSEFLIKLILHGKKERN